MYRINSKSGNMISLQVVQNGQFCAVNLMPKSFVFSEEKTEQMSNLELNKAISVRFVSGKTQRKEGGNK